MRQFQIWIVLGVAALFRFYSLDHGVGLHPDERQIQMVASGLSLKNLDPNFYAYGSLPIYLLSLIQSLGAAFFQVSKYEFGMIAGRFLAATAGLATIYYTFKLSLRLFKDHQTALVSALFLTFSVLHIQLSRFYTVDILMTLTCTAFFYYLDLWIKDKDQKSQLITTVLVAVACATKVAGVYLIAPWLVGFAAFHRKSLWTSGLKNLSVHLLLLAVLSFIFQPYLFLNFKGYYHQLMTQVQMVRGDFTYPYTINYLGTSPLTYHLEQMFGFAINPLMTFLAFLGLFWFLIRSVAQRQFTALCLIGWGLFLFLSIAGQQVKFPRYLLPIYPLLMISTAFFIFEVGRLTHRKWLFKATLAAALGTSVIWAICFMNIFSTEHSTRAASRWILNNVSEGQIVLGEHWDDRIPMSIRTNKNIYGPIQYGPFNELPMYEPDNNEKVELLAARLASATYIALPTAKVYGSILKNPDKYPISSNFYRLLFSEKLGFKIAHTFKSFPQLGPLRIDTQLLDESLSVYDHPKAVIFRKSQQLTETNLKKLIIAGPAPDALVRSQIMVIERPLPLGYRATNRWVVVDALIWFFSIEVIAILLALLIGGYFSLAKTSLIHGLARPFAFFGFGYLTWSSNHILGIANTAANVQLMYLGLLGLLASLLGYTYFNRNKISTVVHDTKNLALKTIPYLLFYFLLLIIRAWYPDIVSSEKTMDFSFINYFLRNHGSTYTEPWASGLPLQYYYLGYYFIASFIKLTGIQPEIAYNLVSCIIPVLSASALFGLFSFFSIGRIHAAIGAFTVLMLSNFVVPFKLIFEPVKLGFDLFWLSARTFEIPAFSEYPFWTFIFNDVHPHFIVQPLNIVVIALILVWIFQPPKSLPGRSLFILSAAFSFGLFGGTNAWDSIIYGIILLFALLTKIIMIRADGIRSQVMAVLEALAVGVIAFALLAPFWADILSFHRDPLHLAIYQGPFNSWKNVFWFLSPWLVLYFSSAISLLVTNWRGFVFHLYWFLMGAGVTVALGAALAFRIQTFPYSIVGLSGLVAGLASASFFSVKRDSPIRSACLLVFIASLAMTSAELVEFEFRMNMIFKSYLAITLFFSIGSWILWTQMVTTGVRFKTTAVVCSVSALALGFIATSQSVIAMSRYEPRPSLRPSLDGSRFRLVTSPDDAAVIDWMKKNIQGTPTIIEGRGVSYASFTRVTMETGLPTVVGWEHHIYQRGVSRNDIATRNSDVDEFYLGNAKAKKMEILKKYNVQFVFVGEEEIKQYGDGIVSQVRSLPGLDLQVAVGRTSLYRVIRN